MRNITQKFSELRETKYPKGMNDLYRPEDLPEGYCVLAQNCFLEEKKIKQRTGYSLAGNDTGELKPINHIAPYEPTGKTKQLLKFNDAIAPGSPSVTNTYLYYWTGSGNWTQYTAKYFTKELTLSSEMAAGNLYITNGTDSVDKWDGSALTVLAAIPKTKYLKWFHNYFWAFNNDTYKSRLYFSNLGAPETFGGSDYIDINPDDNDYGTGLGVLNDTLYIFKTQRIWGLTGFSSGSFAIGSVAETTTGVGCIANGSIVNTGNDIYYLSQSGTIPAFRSLTRTSFAKTIEGGIISNDIQTTMEGLSQAQLSKVTGWYDGRRIWWAVPDAASTTNNLVLVYDTITEGWTKHTGIRASSVAMSTVSGSPAFYIGESGNFARVYVMDSSPDDNGVAIDMQFISRAWNVYVNRKVKYKYLWVEGQTGSSISVGVYTSVEGGAFTSQGTLDLNASGAVFPFTFPFVFGSLNSKRKRFDIGYSPAYTFQVKFTKNDTVAPSIINDWSIMVYAKGARDAK